MINDSDYFIDETEERIGRCLVLKSNWSDRFLRIIDEENISTLRLSSSMGWADSDISFVANLSTTRLNGIEIYNWNIRDVTPLQELKEIRYIGLQCDFVRAPDFSTFEKLTELFLFWKSKAVTIFECSRLEILNVVNFPSVNLLELRQMVNLKQLQITSRKLESLRGIEQFNSLEIIDLAECPRLESLLGLESCKNLERVELDNCKRIEDVGGLGGLTRLKEVLLIDCGKLKSLQPLADLQSLKSLNFAGDTYIEDGVLSFLATMPQLENVRFANRRHYSDNRDELNAILGS